jgi:hypothetical protein
MEHFAYLSAIAHAAYQDILRSLREERVSTIQGTPRRELRNGRYYWYDVFRTGTTVTKRYIGEDTAELAQHITRHQQIAETAAAAKLARARLIRVLRAEGMATLDPATGSIMSALADAGTFRLGGTLVGTHAFRFYEGELNIRAAQADMLQTNDIDIAQFERLSLALSVDDKVEGGLDQTFKTLKFDPAPSLKGNAVWRWRQTTSQTLIEFLTPSFNADEDIRDLPALGVSAQSLHFLNYLIADPIPAAALYRSGVLIQIPRPERYAIHKLIVANRRQGGPDAIKSRKDRLQAAFLIRVLRQDRPDELKEAHLDALSRGPKWGAHIAASLRHMPDVAALLAAL